MSGNRFGRFKCFLRWFFNASPDWSESRSHVTEPETNESRDKRSGKEIREMHRDTAARVVRSEKHRKIR